MRERKHIAKKKTLPYVNAETGQIVDATIYGRCERISSCRYLKYPENDASMSDWVAPVYAPEDKEPIPKEMIEASFNHFKEKHVFYVVAQNVWARKKHMSFKKCIISAQPKNNGTVFFKKIARVNSGQAKLCTIKIMASEKKSVILGMFTEQLKKILNWCKFFLVSI